MILFLYFEGGENRKAALLWKRVGSKFFEFAPGERKSLAPCL
jgi:trehalose utilization protein